MSTRVFSDPVLLERLMRRVEFVLESRVVCRPSPGCWDWRPEGRKILMR